MRIESKTLTMRKVEKMIITQLENMLENDFLNCFLNKHSYEKFYSPFILAYIGIFLNQLKQNKFESLLLAIETKLEKTPNENGIFNFFGNDSYYYDVDTTSIVNTFFLLRKNKPTEYHNQVLSKILKNKQIDSDGIQTWFERPRNNFDWFVNYNVLLYAKMLNKPVKNIHEYLRLKKKEFSALGSQYYRDISFPCFISRFYEIEFHIDLKLAKDKDNKTDTNLFTLGSIVLNKPNTKINLNTLFELLRTNQKYFNSSEGFFSSKELNAAILIYLINNLNNYEQYY